jgi:uncharacterized protein YukE
MRAILTVDITAVRRLAERVGQVAAEVRRGGTDPRSLQPAVAALAAPALVHAACTFLDRWGAAVAELVDDVHRLADALDLVARTYQDAESVIKHRTGG